MFKLIVHVTQVVDTEAEAHELYEEIQGELRRHPNVHVNGQVIRKFTGYSPENPQGHEVPA